MNTRSRDLLAGQQAAGGHRPCPGGPQRLPRSRLVWWPVTEVSSGGIRGILWSTESHPDAPVPARQCWITGTRVSGPGQSRGLARK